tara:strand:+ start:1611 stop:1832 length:222 start_codon:yes stop_codon:yes gene_type:complete
MKRLLLPLLAALALPTVVNAESYWLIIYMGKTGLEKIKMRNLDHCEKEGNLWRNSKTMKSGIQGRSHHYIKAK